MARFGVATLAVLLVVLLLASPAVEARKRKWVMKLTRQPECNACPIFSGSFEKPPKTCDVCVKPVKRKLKKIKDCKKCFFSKISMRRKTHCRKCQSKLMEYYRKNQKKGFF